MIKGHIKKTEFAVVLGLSVNGLGQVRSLSKENIKVFGIYTEKSELGWSSNQCTAIRFSRQKSNKLDFKNRLIRIARNLKAKPVLFPTSDFYVNFISEFRVELKKYFYFNMVGSEKLNTIINKHLIKELAQKNGLVVPETYYLTSYTAVHKISKLIAYPCLIKPINSYSISFPWKNILIENKDELRKFYQLNSKYLKKTVLQELIPGSDDNIYQCTAYCNRKSGVLAIFTMRKIRQNPPFFGVTSYGAGTKQAEIAEQTKIFLENIGYHGSCSLEFKWDEKRNKYFFIEMNPRLPHYNSLFYDSGLNLAYIAYLDQKYPGRKKIFTNSQLSEICWIHFGFDLSSLLAKRRSKQKIALLLWLKSICKPRSFAYWDKRDPLPFFLSLLTFWNFAKR